MSTVVTVTMLIARLDNQRVNMGDIIRLKEIELDAADSLCQPGHRYHIKYVGLADDNKTGLYRVLGSQA